MKEIAENRVDVYRCHACATMNTAADREWCLCTGTERTLVCSKCGHCFCNAPVGWRRDFWRDTSSALAQRRKRIKDEAPGLQSIGTHPVRPVILLVDDDKVVHIVVPRVLAGFRGTLLHAFDGAEGLRIAQEVKPDLVITDALLPKIDGRQISQTLKNSADTCRSKVVVMTAVFKGERYRKEAIREFAVDEYMEKPITAGKLRLVVESMLRIQIPVIAQRQERPHGGEAVSEAPDDRGLAVSDQLLLPPGRGCATQADSGPGQNAQAPLFDAAVIAELRDLADGNEAFVQEVLSAYFEQATEIVDAMRAALSANDTRSFRSGAHALGGSSLQVGAARVATICHAIQSSEDDAPAPLAAALESLASELHRFDASVRLEESR